MSKILSQDHIITCYEADANQLMRPTAMLDLMQEAANVNASALGFGYDEMIGSNIAWVLSRIHVKFINTPKWRQEVNLKTWHKGVSKLFYLRDFILSDKEGNPMVLATTSWLIIDLNTRRLVRNNDLALSDTDMNAIAEPAEKVVLPVDIEPEDVAIMMGMLKIARLASNPQHMDSWVDLAGYAACGGEIAGKEAQE